MIAGAGRCPAAEPALPEHAHALAPGTFFAHALGAIDGITYTNSKEAFLHSYSLGAKYYELDLSFTADGDLVCFHSGIEERVGLSRPIGEVTTSEFLSHRFQGRFTLMTLEEFFRLMASRPDIYLVTDTKDTDFRRSLEAVVATAERVDPALIARIIPQFYQSEQWQDVAAVERDHGLFATVIFTLYRTSLDDDGVVDVASRRRIPIVTMATSRFNPGLVGRLLQVGTSSMVHTVNEPADVLSLLRQGVRGVYSDVILRWWPRHPTVRAAPRGDRLLAGPPPQPTSVDGARIR